MNYRLWTSLVLASLAALKPQITLGQKRAITVEDAIRMTRLADPMYFLGGSYEVAQFSPDRSKFVIVLRKGDLATNTNLYTIYLFHTDSALTSPKPEAIAQLASSSNLPAIREVRWLADSRHLAFLGISGNAPAQVFLLDADSHQVTQKTRHATGVQLYSISDDGKTLLFGAAPEPTVQSRAPETTRVISDKSLADVLFANRETAGQSGFYLYIDKAGESERRIPLPENNRLGSLNRLFVSPNGSLAIVTADRRVIPKGWQAYHDERIRVLAQRELSPNVATGVQQVFLVDIAHDTSNAIVDAPVPYPAQVNWSPDSRSAFFRTFLPLDEANREEKDAIPIQFLISDQQVRRINQDEWIQRTASQTLPLKITLDEDPNTPATIYAAKPESATKTRLMDLNPQFSELAFGRVEELTLNVRGIRVVAGVYYPPDYVPGRRYPLVIQTHGFDRKRFSMDGANEWTSGFAARPLAAKGCVVLQMLEYATEADHEQARQEPSLGNNKLQRAKRLTTLSIEAAISNLDQRSLIDRDRVGISGFSRTVMFTAYTLTHSENPFRAGVLTDGIDAGWYQLLTYGDDESVDDNGGQSPFSPQGLATWVQESPSFSMDRVHTPMRIVALGRSNILEMWEWYSALRLQDKPVEFVEIPGAPHLLERPNDRMAAMQGLVDWFQFWLQGIEDTDPSKLDQYVRWRSLRRQLAP